MRKKRLDKGGTEIIEEATHVIRKMPVRLLAIYYVGTAPFILTFLYFWADMSKDAYAHEHAAEAAFTLSLAYIYMKALHSAFARELRALISGEPSTGWGAVGILRTILVQTAIQPTRFFILPVALLITLPFGWVYAFYQNVTVFGDGSVEGFKEVVRKSRVQAQFSPRQNHVAIAILFAFGAFVFLNVLTVLIIVPHLFKSFFGLETVFTKAGGHFFNTTLLAISAGMTFLALDPLIKTVYVLRCFYGESLGSGEDLRVELRSILRRTGATILSLAIALSLTVASMGAEASEGAQLVEHSEAVISPQELDRSIEDVISKREYVWRLPREVPKPDGEGFLKEFLKGIFETIGGWLTAIFEWVEDIVEWILDRLPRAKAQARGKPSRLPSISPDLLIFLLIAIAASAIGLLIFRTVRREKSPKRGAESEETVTPDLEVEDIKADEINSEKWLDVAQRMLEKGDRRLALRAYFLSSLSHLAKREMIIIALSKSNGEYQEELMRKAQAPDLIAAFAQNVGIFERVWYGKHDVTGEAMDIFAENMRKVVEFA